MSCLGCNLIEIAPKSLLNGRTVCNTCPDWKWECLARDLAGYETNERRAAFLEKWGERHGEQSAKKLRADVWAIMKGAA